MIKGKRQKYKEGAIVKIELTNNRLAFGRLLPGLASMICVYDFVINANVTLPTPDEIVSKPILFYCGLFRVIITKGIFEIIGSKEFSQKEIDTMPPSFTQDIMNLEDCVVFWPVGGDRKATPEECIGLERSSVWNEQNIIERIEDHYAGRKNAVVEYQKVILSKNDIRYLPPPLTLRWDFEKREYYRADK